MRNGNLPRDKLRIHLQYSKDIKGFKLCIGFIVGVRTTEKRFYQMWNFHREWEVCELLWSENQWQLSRYAAEHAYIACLGAQLLHLPVIDLVLTQTSDLCVRTVYIPNVPELADSFLHCTISAPRIIFPCTAILNSKQKQKKAYFMITFADERATILILLRNKVKYSWFFTPPASFNNWQDVVYHLHQPLIPDSL